VAVNKYLPHIIVLPEDDANRQLANGFVLQAGVRHVCIDIRRPAGGWVKVLEDFSLNRVDDLRKFSGRHVVLLIDFDGDFENRMRAVRAKIPEDFAARVFVLGTSSEPERLKAELGSSLEKVGTSLARACVDNVDDLWRHPLLAHNATELQRLTESVRPFLVH